MHFIHSGLNNCPQHLNVSSRINLKSLWKDIMVAWHYLLYSTLIKPSQVLDITAYCFSCFVLFNFFFLIREEHRYICEDFALYVTAWYGWNAFLMFVSMNWPLLHYTRLLSNTLFLNNSNSPLRRLKFFDDGTYWFSENINNILKPLDELWCPDNVRTFRTFFLFDMVKHLWKTFAISSERCLQCILQS